MFMNRVPTPSGGFTISLPLPPGTHDFKFIVGGVWQCDPSKPIHKTGEHENNFIEVKAQAQAQAQEQGQEQGQGQDQKQEPVSRDLLDTAVYLKAVMEIEACTTSVADLYNALALVRTHGLVREQIPTHLLNSSDIWTELLKSKGANGKQAGMPLEALTRNLGKFSSLPNFMGANTDLICARLSSEEDIQKSRIHPFKVLVASRIYGMGKAMKGALTWTVTPRVRDQLTTTFLRSFKNVAPTGKRYMAALDVSGSMSVACMGCPAISCREASAALAHMLYETEHSGNGHVYVRGFTSSTTSGYSISSRPVSPDDGFRSFDHLVRHGMTLEQFIRATDAPYGATDCSLPMLRAMEEGLDVDVFIVMTDSETFAGKVHPQVALESYRVKANKPDAKLIVVGMTANCLTIADPNDRNTLNLAGFDASMPEIIAMFVRGEL
jgi:60 kDa SS-A/Ro ribonucleoprotein